MIKQIDTDLLKKRARAKYFTHGYIFKLINLNSSMQKSYFSTVSCASILQQEDKKITSKYCNQRFCTVCNRIRIAKFVNAYSAELSEFFEPHFVTLTVPNCTGNKLKQTISKMDADFKKMYDILRKRKVNFKAIRKLEVTYNHETDTYHPHYHLIIENFPGFFSSENDCSDLYYVKLRSIINELRKDKKFRTKPYFFLANIAKLRFNVIIDLWLKYNPMSNIVAQDCTPCTENSEIEIFKYFTKVITKVGPEFKFFPEQFDHIFTTIKGKRTFRTYGIKKGDISEDIEEIESVEIEELERKYRVYSFIGYDWYDTETGEALSNYTPSETLKQLINNL